MSKEIIRDSIRKKQATKTISLVLILAVAALFASFPNASAQKFTSTNYLYFRPNPIGVNQELLVTAWITPRPPGSGLYRDVYHDYTFILTKPDGTTQTKIIADGYRDGTVWFTYVPDQIGTWSIQFNWAGDALHTSASTEKQPLVVQQQPIPSWPPAPLPTEPWNFPITPDNREWYSIMGAYLQPTTGVGLGYDGTGQRFNPYSQGPNTAHVLWKLPSFSGVAGLIGGEFGATLNYATSVRSVNVVMAGRGYYTVGGNIYCIDIATGNQLWTAPGSYTVGAIQGVLATTGFALTSVTPLLLSIGSRFIVYNAATGAVVLNMTGIDGTISYLGYDYGQNAYILQRSTKAAPFVGTPANDTDPGPFYLIKLNCTAVGTPLETNITRRMVYNVTSPFTNQDFGICLYNDVLSIIHFPLYGDSGAFNTTTGKVLWRRPIGAAEGFIEQKPESVTSANGVMFFAIQDRKFTAVDMKTGNVLWNSEKADYPWGNFWAYGQSAAYGMVYGLAYDGIYAFDQNTGKINWKYSAGNAGYETPYGTWPFGSADPIVADGKVYAPSTEHSPQFYYRGQRLHVIDAYTGKGIWSITGVYTLGAIAQGSLFATNVYDGASYAFAKGQTATTVSASSKVVAAGSKVLIEGKVTDQSPAQPSTPAVSDASMTAWMEYLHMQRPKPENIMGVPVKLTATDSNGNTQNIETVTSDMNGMYSVMWSPPTEGKYTVAAAFEGSESYYASESETLIGVAAALTPSPEPVKTVNQVSAEAFYAFAAVLIILIIAVAVLMLRKK